MRKKCVWIVCAIWMLLICAGCGRTDVDIPSEAEIKQMTVEYAGVIQMVEQMDPVELFRMVETMEQSRDDLDEENEIFLETIEKWLDVREEIGMLTGFDSIDNIKIVDNGKTISGTIEAQYSKRNMDVTVTFDKKDRTLQSIVLTPIYTKGEALQRAGVNTLLGMGTVFLVLIIISLIIYLFGFIGKWQAKKNLKVKPEVMPAVEPEEEVDLEDDLELVAVITAAIAASEDVPADQLVVRSIRRKNTRHSWKDA